MSVLDAGCGTGAITAGIARRVEPGGGGVVVGIDRDASLLKIAREEHGHQANLSFQDLDILEAAFSAEFDVVTAARTLQWIHDPAAAIRRMKAAAKPGGFVVVLDYSHEASSWQPAPPAEFARFYRAFLDWRTAHGWDNRMGDRLVDLFCAEGLEAVAVHCDDEIVKRSDAGFVAAASIWTHVIQSLGPRIVDDGFLAETGRAAAEERFQHWVLEEGQVQQLAIRTAIGNRAAR